MNKIRILYIVSTLQQGGPSNQLCNIIKYLDFNKFEPVLLTLSDETQNSYLNRLVEINIPYFCLHAKREFFSPFLLLKLAKKIKLINPDIIHTHGIRADFFIAILSYFNFPDYVSSVRAFALEDYLPLYGKNKGFIMAKIHWWALKRCKHPVACSCSLSSRLNEVGIPTKPVTNGVDDEIFKPNNTIYRDSEYSRPLFLVLGSFNKRKNNIFLVEFFNEYFKNNPGTLIFVGAGIELDELKNLNQSENVLFLGRQINSLPYIQQADVLVSASKSEGLPNSVLESMSCGLVSVLSDIPAHIELKNTSPKDIFIYKSNDKSDFKQALNLALARIKEVSKEEISYNFTKYHSAKINSNKYQSIYNNLVADNEK